ncbi:hypothetical protein Nepgr_007881 [Nepenthes gracilis]|uniref:Uncharacterized protein n=1 Tax=Nepenthes gracilis TaxID=150966 RepID=A0AAD3S832_NEPGR|nr:hypothetical protein Nepgr_007881 [Nepenthes gracilis]
MAPLQYLSFGKVFLFYWLLLLALFSPSLLLVAASEEQTLLPRGRSQLPEKTEKLEPPKKKIPTSSTKSKTKLINPSSKNQTKLIKSVIANSTKKHTTLLKLVTDSAKNKTKGIIKSTDDLSSNKAETVTKLKNLNSTKSSSASAKKSSDLLKASSAKNKTAKSPGKKGSPIPLAEKKVGELAKSKRNDIESQGADKIAKKQQIQKPNWIHEDDGEDLVTEFRDLPAKFHETLVPDLHRFSASSKIYLSKANKEISKGFKPYVGTKYAPTMATAISCAFIIIPLLLVSLIFSRFKAYLSLQKIVIFVQVYLCIYFSILCLSSLVTGLEPLRFFYATSQSSYIWLQVLQALGYVFYLLLLLMYLVVVFSTESGLGSKFLSLGQTFGGFSVGLHYYMTVFHRVVLHQPPKTSWKVHGIYATCFLVICLFATAERRKKAYLEDGREGKRN